MTLKVRVTLTSGAAFFLRHALELISEARRHAPENDPFKESILLQGARISGLLALTAGELLGDLSTLERAGLEDTLRVARDLARAARFDPRWARLGLAGDPARELEEIRVTLLRVGQTTKDERTAA